MLALLSACGPHPAGERALPPEDMRRLHALQPVPVTRSGEDAQFTQIVAMDGDSRGQAYVADWFQHRVLVLGGDGRVARTIGRDGAGPGEFRAIRDLQVLPGDSLLVYDPELARVTVFAPESGKPAYTVNLAQQGFGAAPFHLARSPVTGAYLAQYQARFAFGAGNALEARRDSAVLLNPDGSRRARIAAFPAAPFLVARTSVAPNPFGRRGIARLGADGRVVYVWSDSLAIRTWLPSGAAGATVRYRYRPPAVTSEDEDSARAAMGEAGARMFGAVLHDSLPARWPAVADLRIDDAGRIWIQLAGPVRQLPEWAVFSAEGTYLRSVLLPAGTVLHAVRGTRLYAEQKGAGDVPRVVVFEVRGAPR